jgi:hypothetical protein
MRGAGVLTLKSNLPPALRRPCIKVAWNLLLMRRIGSAVAAGLLFLIQLDLYALFEITSLLFCGK